jgi:hypothetical protein
VNIPPFPFEVTDWSSVETSEHPGENGVAKWRSRSFDGIRVRVVEYPAGYAAQDWCKKGHVLFVLEGELHTELKDGRRFVLGPGMSYQVGDDQLAHKSETTTGVKLFIVD